MWQQDNKSSRQQQTQQSVLCTMPVRPLFLLLRVVLLVTASCSITITHHHSSPPHHPRHDRQTAWSCLDGWVFHEGAKVIFSHHLFVWVVGTVYSTHPTAMPYPRIGANKRPSGAMMFRTLRVDGSNHRDAREILYGLAVLMN